MPAHDPSPAVIRTRDASLAFPGRTLWHHLDIDIKQGEFIAVLGPNGSGKTSLIKVLLGLQRLTSGTVEVTGQPARRSNSRIGYVPQQKGFDRDLPLRGRDLVRLGLDGHRWGVPWPSRGAHRRTDEAITDVGATRYADSPLGTLSGGEQQRLRIAQALLGDPDILLCDEPLLSLDLNHQAGIVDLIERRRDRAGTTVLFVTHEINPVLGLVDRILYLAGGRWAIGPPDEVLTSERLSQLFSAPVDVLRVRGRVIVVGASDAVDSRAGGGLRLVDEGHVDHRAG